MAGHHRYNARIFEPRIALASCHIILSVTQNSQMALTSQPFGYCMMRDAAMIGKQQMEN